MYDYDQSGGQDSSPGSSRVSRRHICTTQNVLVASSAREAYSRTGAEGDWVKISPDTKRIPACNRANTTIARHLA